MKRILFLAAAAALSVGVSPVWAQVTYVETFEDFDNHGGWTYGGPNGFIDPNGGNPGAFWHERELDTFAPQPRTTQRSIYTGNYFAKRVEAVGIDLVLFYVDFSAEGRPLSVILVNDNGTPGQGDDDWGAYRIGPKNVPLVGEGWQSYTFAVPSQEPNLPAGWNFIQFGPNSPDPDWAVLTRAVTQLRYFYGDPENFFIFQMWEPGLDNPSITYQLRPGDLNCDGVVNFGDINPFVLAIGNPGEYRAQYPECDIRNGDVNNDGTIDFGDINPFVELLTRQ